MHSRAAVQTPGAVVGLRLLSLLAAQLLRACKIVRVIIAAGFFWPAVMRQRQPRYYGERCLAAVAKHSNALGQIIHFLADATGSVRSPKEPALITTFGPKAVGFTIKDAGASFRFLRDPEPCAQRPIRPMLTTLDPRAETARLGVTPTYVADPIARRRHAQCDGGRGRETLRYRRHREHRRDGANHPWVRVTAPGSGAPAMSSPRPASPVNSSSPMGQWGRRLCSRSRYCAT